MDKFFNVAGPCLPDWHHMVPPEPRLPEARELIDEAQYFVVHAPRQSGKTTTLGLLARQLTSEGKYAALYFSCETGEASGDDHGGAQRGILESIRWAAKIYLQPELWPPDWPDASDNSLLAEALGVWAQACPRPLVLFFDEIDALRGKSLLSVLRQLRAGHSTRPHHFPQSVVLCGLRDVRDYKAAAGGDPSRLGTSSPFNIKAESLRIGDFTFDQVVDLYAQHTEATGQVFTKEALERAFHASQGQPWLVNALAREVVRKMRVPVEEPITDAHMDQAVERLIVARATHLDSLVARLHEPRIKRIIEPMIAGDVLEMDAAYNEDLAYLRDLGLVSRSRTVQIANPIYQEVILRVLGEHAEGHVDANPYTFVTDEGRLDLPMLLREFTAFWKLHGDILANGQTYHEAACQLVFMGYLHRIVNGGGYIDREYGVGRGRIDLLVRWPYDDADGQRAQQWEAMELKVHHPGKADPLPDGLAQLDRYLDRLGLDTGTLVVFDRRKSAPPVHERTEITTAGTPAGRTVTLVRA